MLQAGTVECLDLCHPSQTKVELTTENSGCFLLTSWTQGTGRETRLEGHSLRRWQNLTDSVSTMAYEKATGTQGSQGRRIYLNRVSAKL